MHQCNHRATGPKQTPPFLPLYLKKKLFKHSPLFLHLMCLLATLFVLILHLLWLHRIMKEKKKSVCHFKLMVLVLWVQLRHS